MAKRQNQLLAAIVELAPEIKGAIEELLKAGGDRGLVARLAADLLDGAIDWRTEIPRRVSGPMGQLLGMALEASDGPLLVLVIRPLVEEIAERLGAGEPPA